MNANARTKIANIVVGIFHSSKEEDIVNRETPVSYEFGSDPVQDVRVATSMLWVLRIEFVKLMPFTDKPVYGAGQPSARDESIKAVAPTPEQEEERARTLQLLCRDMGVLEEQIRYLNNQAREKTEEAGKRSLDGERIRFGKKKVRAFRPYLDPFDEWAVKSIASTDKTEYASWIEKLQMARFEIDIPYVDVQTVKEEWQDILDSDRLDGLATKAWDKLLDNFEKLGAALGKHDAFMASHQDDVDAIAVENKAFRKETKDCLYWIDRIFEESFDLLAHVGVPRGITNSPEWRTVVAQTKANEAKAQAAEALAMKAEAEAEMTMMEATHSLQMVKMAIVKQRQEHAARIAAMEEEIKNSMK